MLEDKFNNLNKFGSKSKCCSHVKSLAIAVTLLLIFTLALPATPYIWLSGLEITANTESAVGPVKLNPRSNFWRGVRNGEAGYTTTEGRESSVLINSSGQTWRQYRVNILVPYGSFLMAAALAILAAFYVFRGPIRIESGASGHLVPRFSTYQRIVHWFTAILFWLLALTGLILLYGRYVLKPLLGAERFAVTAAACKEAHNLFGPIFLVALALLFIAYVRDNIYEKEDISWLKNGGGMFGRQASAGRFNFGEKIWFWLVCILGLAVSVSGMLLDFSILGLGRVTMELSHVVHSAAAIAFIAISFGHIYLGVIGTEGTLRGMTTGYVDANWAKHHHDRWNPAPEASVAQQDSANGLKPATPHD